MYIEVVVCKTKTSRRLFTYSTQKTISQGDIVSVPFGKNTFPAICINVVNKPTFKTKEIANVYDLSIPSSQLKLLEWMLEFYPDDFGLIGSQFLPANLSVKPRLTNPNIITGKNTPLPKPTNQQLLALNELSKNNKVILHGSTGSGKTRVFTEKIIESLECGKSVLVITPEIGLTPQLVYDIEKHVNAPVIASHSQLNPAERRRIWDYANSNNHPPTVFVGPRSSIFIPIQKLGLIVIDEFHDQSLKQQNSPRYQTLHVTAKLASIYNCPVILSSATPNVGDLYQMSKSSYKVVVMDQLAVANKPAIGQIIDTNNREQFKKSKYLSEQILSSISSCLSRGEQSMLMLNRRGSARLVKCSNCSWQALCNICGLPLTYHHDNFTLSCHGCGKNTPAPKNCPKCGSLDITFKTIGTKALEEHVKMLFPKAKIIRFDSDVSASEQLHRNIAEIKEGQVDIIIGTQLISKGIDLPKLGMVGVVSADAGLALPDFSAEESLFQQLYQVTGRVGRGHRNSEFFIQTGNPDHPVMQSALNRDYQAFYNYEVNKREMFKYPPFCYLALVKVSKKTASNAEKTALKISAELAKNKNITILGPSPSFYEKSSAGYTWQIIIKSPKRSEILKSLEKLPANDITIDIDPVSLL
ncbi:primosomal protein N' [Candidatus Saccharibacteria bacterium]|nr:primosomal protein N' [Candidatus Saccharibacteria bacterium]